jgi:hypothetical protein
MAVRLSALGAGRFLPPSGFLVLISVRVWVDPRARVRLEGLGQLKNPMTSSGIEPATFGLVYKLSWGKWGKTRKTSARMVGVPAKMQDKKGSIWARLLRYVEVSDQMHAPAAMRLQKYAPRGASNSGSRARPRVKNRQLLKSLTIIVAATKVVRVRPRHSLGG